MNDYLTEIKGVPNKSYVRKHAGMAFFPDTGPPSKTCGDCQHCHILKGTHRKTLRCAMFREMTGKYGPPISDGWGSCKYFKAKKP